MNNVMNYIEYWMRQGLGTPLILIVMISMMMLPLPPFLLDIFFTFNIALSLVVLLAVIYSERPLDFCGVSHSDPCGNFVKISPQCSFYTSGLTQWS